MHQPPDLPRTARANAARKHRSLARILDATPPLSPSQVADLRARADRLQADPRLEAAR